MAKKDIQLPQLILVVKGGGRARFLERLTSEGREPNVDLTFQEDTNDPRIIAIKYQILGKEYQIPGKEKEGSILYYSEASNQDAIVTFNIGYNYRGRVFAGDYKNHNFGFSLEHLSKEGGLRKKHIERINNLEDIRKDLTPEYVAERYEWFFYNLERFI